MLHRVRCTYRILRVIYSVSGPSSGQKMKITSNSRFLIDGFLYILVFPLIVRRARGEDNRAFDLQQYLINYYLEDEPVNQYHPVVTNTATLNNYNNEYPYTELLNFVKETKRILQSPDPADENRKRILEKNFGNRYSAYLRGDNSDMRCPHPAANCPPTPATGLVPPLPPPPVVLVPPPAPPALVPLPPFVSYKPPPIPHTPNKYPDSAVPVYSSPAVPEISSSNTSNVAMGAALPVLPIDRPLAVDFGITVKPLCGQTTQVYRPDRLKSIDGKEQFILNLGNEFVQEIQVVHCRNFMEPCGDRSTWPETYEKVCVQSYNSYKVLFSVPVEKTINILDQKLRVFQVSSGCQCLLKKKSSF